MREWIDAVQTVPSPLYHFTNIKGLIGILRSEAIQPGRNGRVSFTFNPSQSLFRYMSAVLVFDHPEVALVRYEGDAASLAGGDEEEFYANEAVPLTRLQSIVVRPNIWQDDERAFRSMYGIGKAQLKALLQDWQSRGVAVSFRDFNDTETLHEDGGTITPEAFQTAMKTVLAHMTGGATFATTAMELNQGLCAEFAADVVKTFGIEQRDRTANPRVTSTKWYWDDGEHLDLKKARALGEPLPLDLLKTKRRKVSYELGAVHFWLIFNNRHYDAECLDGVDHFLLLPFFQRRIAALRGA